jgi:predicted component of type VI protein secretion system
VDPFNRQPFGPTDKDEYPPRNQFTTSAYKVGLVPEDRIHTASASAYVLPVAKFNRKGDELVRDNDYIPPCAVIAAHGGTKQLYNHLSERLNVIQEHCSEIIRKVVDGGQTTSLALNTKRICEQCLWHISSEFFSFRTIYRKQSPVYMAKCIIQLANIVSLCTSTIPAKEKEELLQYFSHWNDISPGKFEDMLSSAVLLDYSHEDIADSFRPLLTFLKIWTELLEKLKDLKLIGARKEGFDHAALSKDIQKEEKKGKFRIFD